MLLDAAGFALDLADMAPLAAVLLGLLRLDVAGTADGFRAAEGQFGPGVRGRLAVVADAFAARRRRVLGGDAAVDAGDVDVGDRVFVLPHQLVRRGEEDARSFGVGFVELGTA